MTIGAVCMVVGLAFLAGAGARGRLAARREEDIPARVIAIVTLLAAGLWFLLLGGMLFFSHPASAYTDPKPEFCVASWYSPTTARFGQHIAAGGYYSPESMTCAHKKLPFGTGVKVTDLATKRSIICVIDDRGPYVKGRCIDLSIAAANVLGLTAKGLARVKVEVVLWPQFAQRSRMPRRP